MIEYEIDRSGHHLIEKRVKSVTDGSLHVHGVAGVVVTVDEKQL